MRKRPWLGRSRAERQGIAPGVSYLGRLAKVLWSLSYFAASVGYVWESTVRRYIEHRWDAVAS